MLRGKVVRTETVHPSVVSKWGPAADDRKIYVDWNDRSTNLKSEGRNNSELRLLIWALTLPGIADISPDVCFWLVDRTCSEETDYVSH
jgi:hypothetical protein